MNVEVVVPHFQVQGDVVVFLILKFSEFDRGGGYHCIVSTEGEIKEMRGMGRNEGDDRIIERDERES